MERLIPEFVLVRGVAYARIRRTRGRGMGIEYFWMRRSVPPDATPGKRSKWPPTYPDGRLPAHEEIDEDRANEVMKASLATYEQVVAEARRG